MNFTLSDEQRELVRTVTDFMAKRSTEDEVRRLMDAGGNADPEVWTQLAQQLGAVGLAIPEEFGGAGFGFGDLALVIEAAGAALYVGPLLSSASAAAAILLAPSEDLKAQYLPGLASGEKTATLALAEDSGSWDTEAVTTSAVGDRLTGAKMFVVDGAGADLFVVSARGEDGLGLYVVEAGAPEVTAAALDTLDQTRPQARVEFADAPARLLGNASTVEHALAVAGTLLAAEQVGGAQRCLDMAVAYAKARVQFDKPIGSFQAIKHKCADMLLDVESARSAAAYAAALLDEESADTLQATELAQAHCSAAYTRVAGENIQIHGGIGFTWEHPAQLYYKRAKTSELLYGDPARHRARLADLVGI